MGKKKLLCSYCGKKITPSEAKWYGESPYHKSCKKKAKANRVKEIKRLKKEYDKAQQRVQAEKEKDHLTLKKLRKNEEAIADGRPMNDSIKGVRLEPPNRKVISKMGFSRGTQFVRGRGEESLCKALSKQWVEDQERYQEMKRMVKEDPIAWRLNQGLSIAEVIPKELDAVRGQPLAYARRAPGSHQSQIQRKRRKQRIRNVAGLAVTTKATDRKKQQREERVSRRKSKRHSQSRSKRYGWLLLLRNQIRNQYKRIEKKPKKKPKPRKHQKKKKKR